MSDLVKISIMFEIKAMFEASEDGTLTANNVHTITRLTEASFPNAYYADTTECIVKLGEFKGVSMCGGGALVYYKRIRDCDKEQVRDIIKVRKAWKEQTVILAEIELEQAYDRLVSI